MFRMRRLYNQNRRKIWKGLIIAIFCIAIISLMENSAKNTAKENIKKIQQEYIGKQKQESNSEMVDYEKASNSLTSNEKVDKSVRDEVQSVLEQFIKSACNGQIQEAYSLLTQECRELKYPSREIFYENYCDDIQNKTYDFQLWSSENGIYVYRVKYMNDFLSSGQDNSRNYIQDYITVLKQNGVYGLNINKLIKIENIEKTEELEGINFSIKKSETYLDYEVYEFEITNTTKKDIILDTREKDNSVYVKNSDGLKIRALLYENTDEELKIIAGETKKIRIKFNNTYNSVKKIIYIGFLEIINDKEAYYNDSEKKSGKIELEICLK